jgi:oligopeptidase A
MQMVRQLYFGAMDMYLHSDKYDPRGEKTVFAVQHEIAKRYTVMPPLPEDRFLCSFGHIFAGGYSAGKF